MTKDERFLMELYKQHEKKVEFVDPKKIAEILGFKEHLTKNILKGLIQANLVKRYTPDEVALTERGREVARSLLH